MNLYLFESGSSKTSVYLFSLKGDKEVLKEYVLPGYNPNRPNTDFEEHLQSFLFDPNDCIRFYGSGLGSIDNKEKVKALFSEVGVENSVVFDDITGAARALYGKENGLLAIMGTGGCAGYFNGVEIKYRRGGHGYLINDLGGGYELGKRIVSGWLNNDFNTEVTAKIEAHFGTSSQAFTTNYYYEFNNGQETAALASVASVVEIIAPYQNQPAVKAVIENYFDHFFRSEILPLVEKTGNNELRLIGSIAQNFTEIIFELACTHKINLTKILRYPALNLLSFHQEEIFNTEKKDKTAEIRK